MVNFRIIDGDYDDTEKYEKYKDYYLNHLEMSVKQINEVVGISNSKGGMWIKRVNKETGLKRNFSNCNRKLVPFAPKNRIVKNYYQLMNGKFRVTKIVNGETVDFGTYPSEKEAKKIVSWLREHQWDKNSLKNMRVD